MARLPDPMALGTVSKQVMKNCENLSSNVSRQQEYVSSEIVRFEQLKADYAVNPVENELSISIVDSILANLNFFVIVPMQP